MTGPKLVLGDWQRLGQVAPRQVRRALQRELDQTHPARTRGAITSVIASLNDLTPARPGDRGYWLPVVDRCAWVGGGVLRLSITRRGMQLGTQGGLEQFEQPLAQVFEDRLRSDEFRSSLSVDAVSLKRLSPSGPSWVLAAEVAHRAAQHGHTPSGRVVLTGNVGGDGKLLPVQEIAAKARAAREELGRVHFIFCTDETVTDEQLEGLSAHRFPTGSSLEAVWQKVLELERSDARTPSFNRAFAEPRLDDRSRAERILNQRRPERSALARIVTETVVPGSLLDRGTLRGWERRAPEPTYGWWGKMQWQQLERTSSLAFRVDDRGPLTFELPLGHLKRARLHFRGEPTVARLESVDLVPHGELANGFFRCALGFVLSFEPCSLEQLTAVTTLRLSLWELEALPSRESMRDGSLGRWPRRLTLGGLFSEVAHTLVEDLVPGLPGRAGLGDQLSRSRRPEVISVFQAAWLQSGGWHPPDRLDFWDRFSALRRPNQHDGTPVTEHWPNDRHKVQLKSGCLYGYNPKAVSFLLDDQTEFSHQTKGTVIMKSHYLHWLLARRRLALGLPPMKDDDLAALCPNDPHHGAYLRWVEQACRRAGRDDAPR